MGGQAPPKTPGRKGFGTKSVAKLSSLAAKQGASQGNTLRAERRKGCGVN